MDGPCGDGFRDKPGWVLALAAVVAGQIAIAVGLFGGVPGVTDDRPVLSGRHPLHLYHGVIGAEAFRDTGTTACFDPAFQAGYPKTPVFDGGSRPAEFVLALVGTARAEAAYKLMLLAVCGWAPLAFALSARGAGSSAAGACLAAAAGTLLWWTPPVQAMFRAGEIDLLVAGLLGIVCVGGFSRYHREPGPVSWATLAATSMIGWYAHPVVWIAFAPILIGYYLALAPRHGPAWHLGLAGVLILGLVPNIWWLSDWGRFWWLREQEALADGRAPLGPAAVFGAPVELAALLGPNLLGWPAVLAGLVGCIALARCRRRTSGWLFAVAVLAVVAVARLGQVWAPVQSLGLERAAPLAVGLALVPAAAAFAAGAERTTLGRLALFVCTLAPAGLAGVDDDALRTVGLIREPLTIGFTPGQLELAEALRNNTTAEARILIEDPESPQPGWNWTALMPRATGRTFLGGLDAGACVDLSYCGMKRGRLNDRPLSALTDDDLAELCRVYNIGWVLSRTPAATARWKAWGIVTELGRFEDGGEVVLLAIRRPMSFVLTGSATVVQADRRQIVLDDLTPSPDGDVLLSFHHQPGMRVTPPTVVIDEAKDPYDPTKFLRLRIRTGSGAARVIIRWNP